jgi:hypothetical protein
MKLPILRAAMSGPLRLPGEHRAEVEGTLRPYLTEPSSFEDVFKEVEELLGELRFCLETGVHGAERRAETVSQLEEVRDAAERLRQAASALGDDAHTALFIVDGQAPEQRLEALRRSALFMARDARFAAENLRSEPASKRGRPKVNAERRAVWALMRLWENHTGRRPSIHGAREDGGPCLAFVNACIRAVPGLGGFNGERVFRDLLKASKAK